MERELEDESKTIEFIDNFTWYETIGNKYDRIIDDNIEELIESVNFFEDSSEEMRESELYQIRKERERFKK